MINAIAIGLLIAAMLLVWFNLWRIPYRLLYRILLTAVCIASPFIIEETCHLYERYNIWSLIIAFLLAAVVFVPIHYGKSIKLYIKYKQDLKQGNETAWYSEWKQSNRAKRDRTKARREAKSATLPPPPLKHPSQMSGYDYEQFLAGSLKAQGYTNVKVTPKSGDYGADVIATNRHGEKICFQCKHYNGVVGIDSVQEITAAKKYYGCSRGAVVTNSKFTKAAKELALSNDIDLFEEYEALFYD